MWRVEYYKHPTFGMGGMYAVAYSFPTYREACRHAHDNVWHGMQEAAIVKVEGTPLRCNTTDKITLYTFDKDKWAPVRWFW